MAFERYPLKVKANGSHSRRVRSRVNIMFCLYREFCVNYADPRATAVRPTPGVKREEVKLSPPWITPERGQLTDYAQIPTTRGFKCCIRTPTKPYPVLSGKAREVRNASLLKVVEDLEEAGFQVRSVCKWPGGLPCLPADNIV